MGVHHGLKNAWETAFMIDCVGLLTTSQPLWIILCRLPEKGRKEIIRDSREDEREEQRRKRNRNKREETEEMKTFPLYLTCYIRIAGLAQL